MLRSLHNLLLAEDGQDLVEYALLAALVAVASIVALRELGPVISSLYGTVDSHLQL